jgi:hypothetical protein
MARPRDFDQRNLMKNFNRPTWLLAALFAAVFALIAQSLPSLGPCYAGAVVLSGKIAPGAGPVAIYDLSYPAQTKLGSSQSVDANGNFAVSVKPPLILGHHIVAVDANGVTSVPTVVTNQPANPAGPGN